jgi:hypothetical protein
MSWLGEVAHVAQRRWRAVGDAAAMILRTDEEILPRRA